MLQAPGPKFLPSSATGPFPWPHSVAGWVLLALLSLPAFGLAAAAVTLWLAL